ncbi:MAG: TonB-dependent receptor [Novosphingobium sp.]|nr:TonB-dependent receptor [Novosphingobium sp.]
MIKTGMLALAGVSLTALSVPAMAQSSGPEADSAASVDEIIVQARRRDESIQDVPVVVQAVTSQELADLNIREFQDVQSLVPGLRLGQDANGIGAQATLRGIAYDVNASGNNGTVEFYMNDAPISAGILFQSMFDVGQIEVLRGPQGTLRGRASPSGSITVTTRQPDLFEAGGYMTGTVNDIGGWNINGAVNVPVIGEKLAVRIAGIVSENDDNDVRSINSSLRPYSETTGLRASVKFEPFDILTLGFVFTNTDRKQLRFDQVESASLADPTAAASPVLIRGTDRLSVMASPRTLRQRFTVYDWNAELRLAGQKLNYVGSYTNSKYDSVAPDDIGGFYGPQFPARITSAGLTTATRGDTESHEIRLSNQDRIAGMFDYVIGYLKNDSNSPTNLVSDTLVWLGPPQPSLSNLLAAVKTPIVRTGGSREESFFGNVTVHFGQGTEVSGGVRRIKFRSFGALEISGAPVAAADEDSRYKATIYQASLKHRFNQSLMAYASFGTSWRPGSSTNAIIQRNNLMPTALQQSLLFPDPEKSKSYEIGFKSDWFDRRLTLNVSAFHQTFKNFGYFSRDTFVASVTAQGPQAELLRGIAVGVPAKVDGVEAEIAFRASDNFSISSVLSYTKSKIRNGTVPCNDYLPADGVPDSSSQVPSYEQIIAATNGGGVGLCDVSSRAGFSAPFSASVQSEYNMPLSNSMEGYLRGLVTYQGNSQNDPTNRIDDIKAYADVNLFAGVRDPDGGWEVGLFVKNVFDTERALLRGSSPASLNVRSPGVTNNASTYRTVSYTPPREFGVTARISIGSR